LWNGAMLMRRGVSRRADPRVREHYTATLTALNRMRQSMGRTLFAEIAKS
jgi:hypothetical protein